MRENETYELGEAQQEASEMQQKLPRDYPEQSNVFTRDHYNDASNTENSANNEDVDKTKREHEGWVKYFINALSSDQIHWILANENLLAKEIIDDPKIRTALRHSLVQRLQQKFDTGNTPVLEIEKNFSTESFIHEPDVQEAIKQRLVYILVGKTPYNTERYDATHRYQNAVEFLRSFDFLDGCIEEPEIQEALKSCLLKALNRGMFDEVVPLIRPFRMGLIVESDEVQDLCLKQFSKIISNNDFEKAKKLADEFCISTESVMQVISEKLSAMIVENHGGSSPLNDNLLAALEQGDEKIQKNIDSLVNAFGITTEFISASAMKSLATSLRNQNSFCAKEIEKEFSLESKIRSSEVAQSATEGLIKWLNRGDAQGVRTFMQSKYLPEDVLEYPAVKEAILNGIIKVLSANENSFLINSFISEARAPQEVIHKPEAVEEAIKFLTKMLAKGDIDSALDAIELFSFSAGDQTPLNSIPDSSLKNNLIKFIPHLSNQTFTDSFPAIVGRVEHLILENLENDLDLADYFIENLDKNYNLPWAVDGIRKAIKHYSVAEKFVDQSQDSPWSSESWVTELLNETYALHQNLSEDNEYDGEYGVDYDFKYGDEGFSESDPYENHEWLFNEPQAKLSVELAKAIRGDLAAVEELDSKLKEQGIDIEAVNWGLNEIYDLIYNGYQEFVKKFITNQKISNDDAYVFSRPNDLSVKLTPLLESVQALAARYITQILKGEISGLAEIQGIKDELAGMLKEGFARYVQVHEVDILLYDKLYEEFDNLRETGRYPLEVYLGRDGIYAWVGRRAQDVARRRKLGWLGRKKQQDGGEVIEINPKYMVYPRYFRDNLDYDTKRAFLEQEGISPDADPLFYDTGYTGTIPEQIMEIMDFEPEDIERRIRLLSAPSAHRRVKGIAENARSEVVEYIEHNSKTEEAAVGLIKDESTGRIRHIAEPTSPREQFFYGMVKQALSRHYWLKEKLHHEPSGNINLDSERYRIRIRQEYFEALPLQFKQDPKAYFEEHGEILKASSEQDEYQDEQIVLFRLEDGSEIIAKKIEIRKAKEARKEFSILIAAKKAGLPTAEPVGFISGKEDKDGDYLLMKKLEGRSGRKFEQELKGSGKFDDEQIAAIMLDVSDGLNEIADTFRRVLGIDKRWRIKDTIIEFDEDNGKVERVIPIDWERVESYDPDDPKKID